MGATTNGALCETTGEEEIQALGTGVVRDVMKGMKGDYFTGGDILQTDWAWAVKGAMVTTGTGREVFIKPGVSLIGRVLLTSDKIGFAVGVSFEQRAKIQELVQK